MHILTGLVLTGCASTPKENVTLAIEPLRQASLAEQKNRIANFKKVTSTLPIKGVVLNLNEYANRIEDKKLVNLLDNLGINKVYIKINSLEDLNEKLTLFLAQVKEKNISPEIYISLHETFLPCYQSTFDKLFSPKPVNFLELVKAIDNYVSLISKDGNFVNLTIQCSPHNLTSSFITNKRASLYVWSEENFGINQDNDQLFNAAIKAIEELKLSSKMKVTIALEDFYHQLALKKQLSKSQISDILALRKNTVDVMVISTGNQPSQVIKQAISNLSNAKKGNVVISLVLAPHSNITKGQFRHRDWNDLVRFFTFFNRYLKRYPALKGFVIDSLPIMEHLLLESK